MSKVIDFIAPRARDGIVLELGCSCWHQWFKNTGLSPKELHCINISHSELQKGIEKAKHSRLAPTFHLMDAHKLAFENDTFDVVFGGGILHHLSLEVALKEIARVLKPGGIATFHEPLDINPVGKLVRYFTPNARTEDEKPFTFDEIRLIQKHFGTEIETFEFTSVPLGVLSRYLFNKAENPMTINAHKLDETLKTTFPKIRWLYRNMNIYIQNTKVY